jgi:uncharacterized protein (TIGR03435 family)
MELSHVNRDEGAVKVGHSVCGAPVRKLERGYNCGEFVCGKETPIHKLNVSLSLFVAIALLAAGVSFGQTAPGKLAFEVASVRPSAPLDLAKLAAQMQAGKMPRFGAHVDASRAEYDYMSLKDLIANAYDVKAYQITGPGWLGSERFDIVAKMPEGAQKDDAPKMLQALLEERFKLTVHRDTEEHPVLALVVGKEGPKLKESTVAPVPIDEDAPLKPGEFKMDGPDGPIRVTRNADGSTTMNMGAKGLITQKIDMQTQTVHMESTMVTMAGFADQLTSLLQMGGGGGRQVVDMTELKGNYQVAVDVSLADLMAMAREKARELGVNLPAAPASSGAADNMPASAVTDPSGGSSVFTSVEKLGLKLDQRKSKVEQVVIDSVEKTPTEN